MEKFYRVKKDTFLWEEGAILKREGHLASGKGGYSPIEDIWNKVHTNGEYITSPIIEGNPEWFERVYRDDLKGNIFRTADQMRDAYKEMFKQ